ncbi:MULTISPECIES: ATP-binding protein [Sedimentibacter]|uniref:ATP-binding protein n=1 Tax=Sedimentibacter hydroxybenzoicus DSM 7310 TaxID=1123245 RepID=A0A974BKI5_SEDHY|nr:MULTISPECIES: ATP-binding protein [Sedimentibacter]NYB74432.1 ATP-binding protein [Sedimentibacter hydroxybenzoicus DSM 7310]
MDYKVERYLKSDINNAKITVEEILDSIKNIVSENTFFNTKLILNELIINSILHGNQKDKSKQVFINLLIDKSCIIIEVADEGLGICYKKKAYGDYDFCESGRGLMLVEGLSDKFEVCGNRVKCVQYIK